MNSPILKAHDVDVADAAHLEMADYFNFGNEQLYYVLHPCVVPVRARMLLAGPFASERPHRYIAWVRWARYLASRGIEVMRFDHRGVGESTGRFEDYSFSDWIGDLEYCAKWLQRQSPQAPLLLHGLGQGALLAEQAFRQGLGDMFLAWLPPKSAREMLYDQLKIKMANNFILPASERKTRDQFVAELEQGGMLEVEGHNWTPKLWAESEQLVFGDTAGDANGRPWAIGKLDALAAHTLGGVGPNPMRSSGNGPSMRLVNPDLSASYASEFAWLSSQISSLEKS